MDATLPPSVNWSPTAERARQDKGVARAPVDESKVDPATRTKIRKAADEFEAQFFGQMLAPMFETVGTDPNFGGGHGEEMFRSMLVNEYGKKLAQHGNFGISNAVYGELLRAQEDSHGKGGKNG